MYYIVYDNFLPDNEYGDLKSYLGPNGGFPWQLSGRINNNDVNNGDMYFATKIFHAEDYAHDQWSLTPQATNKFLTITNKLWINGLHRIKCNLYFPSTTGEVSKHASHVDADFPHQGALFYLTSCNAPTTMADGTEIEAVENRLLLFDPSTPHSSSSPTDTGIRITINFNYWGGGVHPRWKFGMLNPTPTLQKNAHLLEGTPNKIDASHEK